MVYTVRFWNPANECISVGGHYLHDFDTKDDAWDAAYALLASAHKHGAVEMDINNVFYPIIDDADAHHTPTMPNRWWEPGCEDDWDSIPDVASGYEAEVPFM